MGPIRWGRALDGPTGEAVRGGRVEGSSTKALGMGVSARATANGANGAKSHDLISSPSSVVSIVSAIVCRHEQVVHAPVAPF